MNKQSEKAYGLSDLYSAISSMLQPRMEQSLSKVSVLIGWFCFRRVRVEWAGVEYAGDEPTLEEFILWMAGQIRESGD